MVLISFSFLSLILYSNKYNCSGPLTFKSKDGEKISLKFISSLSACKIQDNSAQQLLDQLSAFLNLCKHVQNQFIPSFYSWHTANFKIPRPKWWHTFLTMHTWTLFNQLFIFMSFHQHAKNWTISSFCYKDIVDLKILQSDWPGALWTVYHFCKHGICIET